MRPAILLSNHNSLEDLQRICKDTKDQVQKNRLRAIINIKKGRTRTEIVETFNVSRDTVTNWVNRYNKEGVQGLKENLGGRKDGNPKWDVNIFKLLAKEIDVSKGYWSIPLMQKWIEKEHKEIIPEQTVWYHIRKENYTYKSSRPHPMLGNKDKQEAFKKGA
jgi:transposase